jgi:hypothetical protein
MGLEKEGNNRLGLEREDYSLEEVGWEGSGIVVDLLQKEFVEVGEATSDIYSYSNYIECTEGKDESVAETTRGFTSSENSRAHESSHTRQKGECRIPVVLDEKSESEPKIDECVPGCPGEVGPEKNTTNKIKKCNATHEGDEALLSPKVTTKLPRIPWKILLPCFECRLLNPSRLLLLCNLFLVVFSSSRKMTLCIFRSVDGLEFDLHLFSFCFERKGVEEKKNEKKEKK